MYVNIVSDSIGDCCLISACLILKITKNSFKVIIFISRTNYCIVLLYKLPMECAYTIRIYTFLLCSHIFKLFLFSYFLMSLIDITYRNKNLQRSKIIIYISLRFFLEAIVWSSG